MSIARVLAAAALTLHVSCFAGPVYDGPESDHFDGHRFYNVTGRQHADSAQVFYWLVTREPGEWAEWTDAPPGPAPPERVEGDALRVTWVNHATVLVQTAGLNVLTDPVWSHRVGPTGWTGPERKRPVGIRFEDLPPIDLVVISHNHYDHLDLPTLKQLAAEHGPRFVAGLGAGLLLVDEGIPNVSEIDWWQRIDLGSGRSLVGVPAEHFSGRGISDMDRTLWLGFLLETPAGGVYYAGDTGFGPHYLRLRERYGPPRLAILPISPAEPPEIMARIHMSPEEAVWSHRILGAGVSVPVHWGTFQAGDDAQYDPPMRLLGAMRGDELESFWILEHGTGYQVPPLASAAPHHRRTPSANRSTASPTRSASTTGP